MINQGFHANQMQIGQRYRSKDTQDRKESWRERMIQLTIIIVLL